MRSALLNPSDDGDPNRSPLSYSSRGLYSRKPSTLLTGSSQSSNGLSSGRGTSSQMGGFPGACRSSPARATHALNLNHYQWPEFKSDLGHLKHGTPTFLLPFLATIFNSNTFDHFFKKHLFCTCICRQCIFYVAVKKDYCG